MTKAARIPVVERRIVLEGLAPTTWLGQLSTGVVLAMMQIFPQI